MEFYGAAASFLKYKLQTMKNLFLLAFALLILGASCKSRQEKEEANREEELAESIESSADKFAEDIKNMVDPGGKEVRLVDLADLKALLPKDLDGMDRQDLTGEGVGVMGFKMNKAEARYEKGDKSIKLSLIDFGGFSAALLGIAAWSLTDIYHEDDDGYEKSATWKGYKVFEKSNRKDHTSSLALIFKNRLVLNAEADQVTIEKLKDIISDEILEDLEDLDLKEK